MNKEYTNKQLSEDYFKVAASYCKDNSAFKPIKRKISEASVSIQQLYNTDGSLSNLNIKGIGPITINTLENILENGVDILLDHKREEADKRKAVENKNSSDNYIHNRATNIFGKIPIKNLDYDN